VPETGQGDLLRTGDLPDVGDANLYMRLLVRWVRWVAVHPVQVLAGIAILTLGSLVYSADRVQMNSDDSTLISQDEPFRQDYKAFSDRFPQFDETTLIVITSPSIDRADDAVDRLSEALEARDDLISSLYAPSADPFFEDHGLLYLDEDDLDDVIERLAEAQPALTALSEDPSLRGLFDQLELSVEELEEGELPSGFARMADRVSETAEGQLAGVPTRIAWADQFIEEDGDVYRLIIVQGQKDFEETISSTRLINGIRELVAELGLVSENGVRVRLTGMVPLAHEEQESLQRGLALSGTVALALLTVILGFGVRSLRIIVATLMTLLASLSWTTAWAMLSVGEFNIISAAFGVLLIGLGVDFAIHFGLAYEEHTRRGLPVVEALGQAAAEVGGAVSLCGLTSAIGFLSFVPTRYYGLGALGIIAGGGMLISLLASFTVLPALLALMRAPSRQNAKSGPVAERLYPVLVKHARAVVWTTALLAIVALGLSSRMTFDFSTLGMKDPRSESMTTLRELQAEDIVTDYSATLLAPDLAASEALAARLEALPLVSEARSPISYVPEEQDAKLEVLADAAFFLESVLYPEPPRPPPTPAQRRAAIESLRAKIAALPPGHDDEPAWRAARRLGSALEALLAADDPDRAIAQLEAGVVSDLGERLEWLRRAVLVEPVGFDDLPASLQARLISSDGRARVVALPEEDVSDVVALASFVQSVATVDPHATGRPAVEAGIGEIVVSTFRTAIAISFTAVGLILLLTLRSASDALMVLLPITLAAFFTIAFGVAIEMRFNMANVVVIPLILGLGVDNGIHVFMRFRHDGSLSEMMGSSTPRAVVLSTLTTLAAFGSLSLSGHYGIHSMGVLLSVAVISLILCTLIVLPAMILVREGAGPD
jgi:hopanoid biosynthesis associated RND transporter like protein HpnN